MENNGNGEENLTPNTQVVEPSKKSPHLFTVSLLVLCALLSLSVFCYTNMCVYQQVFEESSGVETPIVQSDKVESPKSYKISIDEQNILEFKLQFPNVTSTENFTISDVSKKTSGSMRVENNKHILYIKVNLLSELTPLIPEENFTNEDVGSLLFDQPIGGVMFSSPEMQEHSIDSQMCLNPSMQIDIPRPDYSASESTLRCKTGYDLYDVNLYCKEGTGEECQKDFNQILSTFKFTKPIADVSTWKTYKNTKYNYEFKYPDNVGVVSEYDSRFLGPPQDPEESLLLIADKEKTFHFQINDGILYVIKQSKLGEDVISTLKFTE